MTHLIVGFEGQDVAIPLSDTAGIDALVREAHLLEGWPLINRFRDDLERRLRVTTAAISELPRQPESRNVGGAITRGIADNLARLPQDLAALAAWRTASLRFAPEVAGVLARVEEAAIELALGKLAASREQVKQEAKRYLAIPDDSVFEGDELTFPTTTALARNEHVLSLRKAVQELAQAEAEAASDAIVDAFLAAMASAVNPALGMVMTVANAHDTIFPAVARATLRNRLANAHPVLFRLDPPARLPGSGPVSEVTDEELLESLTELLSETWNACATVGKRVAARMVLPAHVRSANGPSDALGKHLERRGIKGGGSFIARFQNNPLGPWEFQPLIADIVHDLAGPGPSLTRQAVHDVYRAAAADLGASFAEAATVTGALVTLHIVAPPVAIAADIVLATKAIIESVASYLRDRDAYRCALNPAESLGIEPSVIRLALQCAGEVAGALPGGRITTAVSVVTPLTAALAP